MRTVSYMPNAPHMALWDDLIDRLRVLDVGYLSGGSYGRACLCALSALLAHDQPFPFDYARTWEDAAQHMLDGLRLQAR
jgi:hypothetical protein